MSQVPGGAPLGTERIDFTANTAPLEAGVAKAVETAKAGAVAAQAAANAVPNQTITGPYKVEAEALTQANREVAMSADVATSSFGKMRGQIMGLAIPFAVAIGAANRMAAAWDANDKEMEEFALTLSKDPIKALEEYNKKVEEVRSRTDSSFGRLREAAKGWFNTVNPLDQYDLETQKEKLEVLWQQGVALTSNADSERDRLAAAQATARVERETKLKEEVEAETLARLDGVEKVALEEEIWQREYAERRAALEKDGTDLEIVLLARLNEEKTKGFQKQRDEANKAIADKTAEEDKARSDKEAKDKDSADRVAKHAADAMSKALSQVQQQANALFSPDKLGIHIQELGRIMQEVASNTRNLR